MKSIKFSFTGRQSGAIGIFYKIVDSYSVETIDEAKSLLWEDYEHISNLKITGCTVEEFNAAKFTPVRSNRDRARNEKGEYLKS